MHSTILLAVITSASAAGPTAPIRQSEAPIITETPETQGTDFYMFRSYEPGRSGFVTLIANYQPFQNPFAGPNYFPMNEAALYEIHIDNNGDAQEDLTFQFRFQSTPQRLTLPIGPPGAEVNVPVPFLNVGPISAGNTSNLNTVETYTLEVITGDRRSGTRTPVVNTVTALPTFVKPADNIGNKTFADYETYARSHIYGIALPGGQVGRMFVGQRRESFVANLGEIFDLLNFDPIGPPDARGNDLEDMNITSLALELPISFLAPGTEPVIGGWTTSSLPRNRTRVAAPNTRNGRLTSTNGSGFQQVSRVGNPLFEPFMLGVQDKGIFDRSEPKDDAQFLQYLEYPSLPAIIETVHGAQAPLLFPRFDMVESFFSGFSGINQPANFVPGDMVRLNTSFPATASGLQSELGLLGGDIAGYPNGRRPGDDVVDIVLRIEMGILLSPTSAPSGALPFSDGAYVDSTRFAVNFPYLMAPMPGSPQSAPPPLPDR